MPNLQTLQKPQHSKILFCASLIFSSALLMTGCGGDGGNGSSSSQTTNPEQPKVSETNLPVDMKFVAVAPNTAGVSSLVNCENTYMLGSPASKTQVADLRFYVTNVQVLTKDGKSLPVTLSENEYQQPDVALIDLEKATGACADRGDALFNNQLVGMVKGKFDKQYQQDDLVGISFDVGVPFEKNHTQPNDPKTKAPLDVMGMAWSWQIGRKFAKIELKPEAQVSNSDGTTAKIYNMHLGRTGCKGDGKGDATKGDIPTCDKDNIVNVSLSDSQSPLSTSTVVMDLAPLYANSDITKNKSGATGCMSFAGDEDCAALFLPLGLDVVTGKASGSQSLFSLMKTDNVPQS